MTVVCTFFSFIFVAWHFSVIVANILKGWHDRGNRGAKEVPLSWPSDLLAGSWVRKSIFNTVRSSQLLDLWPEFIVFPPNVIELNWLFTQRTIHNFTAQNPDKLSQHFSTAIVPYFAFACNFALILKNWRRVIISATKDKSTTLTQKFLESFCLKIS